MEKLNIITRCSRINNLYKLSESIFSTDKFDITWYLVFDTNFVTDLNIDLLLHLQSLNVVISFAKSIQGDHGHQLINKCNFSFFLSCS